MAGLYRPSGFGDVTPYLTVDNAGTLIEFMVDVFGAEILRKETDEEGDRMAAKRTFAVRYGDRITARAAALLEVCALGCAFLVEPYRWVLLTVAVASLPLYLYISLFRSRAMVFQAFKVPVFVFTVCIVYAQWWYGAVIVVTFLGSRLYYQNRFGKRYPTFRSE